MKHTKQIFGILAITLASANVNAAEDSAVTLSGGFDYSSGSYGGSTTTSIVSIPVNAMYASGAWFFKLSLPYLLVSGGDNVVASGAHSGRQNTSGTTVKRSIKTGLGDVVTTAGYNLYSGADYESGIDLAARIKFGTASETLGTGENDYALHIAAYRDLGQFTPNLVLGYEVLGSSATLALDNVWYGALGGSYRLGEQSSVGAEFKYAQKASVGGAPQRELTLYVSRQFGDRFELSGYLLHGYSTSSPDYGLGLAVSSAF